MLNTNHFFFFFFFYSWFWRCRWVSFPTVSHDEKNDPGLWLHVSKGKFQLVKRNEVFRVAWVLIPIFINLSKILCIFKISYIWGLQARAMNHLWRIFFDTKLKIIHVIEFSVNWTLSRLNFWVNKETIINNSILKAKTNQGLKSIVLNMSVVIMLG